MTAIGPEMLRNLLESVLIYATSMPLDFASSLSKSEARIDMFRGLMRRIGIPWRSSAARVGRFSVYPSASFTFGRRTSEARAAADNEFSFPPGVEHGIP